MHGLARRRRSLDDPVARSALGGSLVARHQRVEGGVEHGAAHRLLVLAHVLHVAKTGEVDGYGHQHGVALRNQVHQTTAVGALEFHRLEEVAMRVGDLTKVPSALLHALRLIFRDETGWEI